MRCPCLILRCPAGVVRGAYRPSRYSTSAPSVAPDTRSTSDAVTRPAGGVGVVSASYRVAGTSPPDAPQPTGTGHIALIVAGSLLLGLLAALLFDLVVFVGAREHV